MDAVAAGVYAALTSRQHRRSAIQHPEAFAALVERAVRQKKPIQLAILWGVWKKPKPTQTEMDAVAFLEGILTRVRDVYPAGATLTAILSDTHAVYNLKDARFINHYDGYLASMERLLQARGHSTVRLSEIVKNTLPKTSSGINQVEISKTSAVWKRLVASSAKYFENGSAEQGARGYVELRLREKPALQNALRETILLSFSTPEQDWFASNVPTLHVFSSSARTTNRPWFELEGLRA